jgi:hypothetical protein
VIYRVCLSLMLYECEHHVYPGRKGQAEEEYFL